MDTYIAVDIGGTQLRAAVFPEGESKPTVTKRIPTKGKDQSTVDRLLDLIASAWPSEGTVKGIGLAAPGPLNHRLGIIYRAPNIPGWENLPLAKIVRDRFSVPAVLGNDANMAALGEWKYGAARGYSCALYITVSTGIGGGIIEDGKLLLGANGLAGELGHVTVQAEGPLCGCGHRGHLESFASGTAISNYVREQLSLGVPSSLSEIHNVSARDVSMAAEQGDPLAKSALHRAGTYLGHALADYLHMFNPAIIVLGGGVSRSGSLFIEPLRAAISERILAPEYLHGLVITTAVLGDDAGLMGTLALAQTAS
jgi:glucokinase